MKLKPKITLLDHFAKLTDPRIDRTKEHKLIDILTIAICGMICGADNWVAMEQYGNSKQEWLKQFLELPNGIPSHDTIARVFARIDPLEFEQCFRSWVKEIAQLIPGEVISIDGKTLKHSGSKGIGRNAIHLVNAWANEQRFLKDTASHIVLGQVKVNDKSNEITAIPELIKVLELSGCLVTIDAMGTQTQIAHLIKDQGADYCLALKGNHKYLHSRVMELFSLAEAQDWSEVEHDFHRTINKGHGRTEIRRYWTMPTKELCFDPDQWVGLQSVGLVESVRKIGSETSTSKRYYLNSFTSNAQLLAHAVRSHWGVENSLHWVLDLGFREDDCPIHSDYAPENLARLRKMSLNLLSQEKTAKVFYPEWNEFDAISELANAKDKDLRQVEITDVCQAIKVATQEYWATVSKWLTRVFPADLDEVIISGGASRFLEPDLEKHFNCEHKYETKGGSYPRYTYRRIGGYRPYESKRHFTPMVWGAGFASEIKNSA